MATIKKANFFVMVRLPSDQALEQRSKHHVMAEGTPKKGPQFGLKPPPASYGRLRRFDLDDQAYLQAIRPGGETVQVLNDQGYSYMLRGNLSAARRKFEKAYSLDPSNPVIVNNLELLNG